MKPTITFEHVGTTSNGRCRVYKASQSMALNARGERHATERRAVRLYADASRSPDRLVTRYLPTRFRYVVVSDARTHAERLAFPGWDARNHPTDVPDPYVFWEKLHIAGAMTFLTHGGDFRSCKPDEVYLRMLARANGYQYVRTEVHNEHV